MLIGVGLHQGLFALTELDFLFFRHSGAFPVTEKFLLGPLLGRELALVCPWHFVTTDGTIQGMTHQLFCVLQQHFPKQNGFLFARIGADGFQQSGLSVTEGQLDRVFANKSGIRIHAESLRTVGGNWVSAHEAALRGLHAGIRGDQALCHALGLPANLGAVLTPCDMDGQRNVVNLDAEAAIVDTPSNHKGTRNQLADCQFAGLAARGFGRPSAEGQQRLLLRREAGEVVVHLGPLLLCSLSAGVVYQWATATMRPALILHAEPQPFFREQHLTGQHRIAFALKGDGKLFRTRARAVGHVLQVPAGRINLQGESFALLNAQALPISFEVHG